MFIGLKQVNQFKYTQIKLMFQNILRLQDKFFNNQLKLSCLNKIRN